MKVISLNYSLSIYIFEKRKANDVEKQRKENQMKNAGAKKF